MRPSLVIHRAAMSLGFLVLLASTVTGGQRLTRELQIEMLIIGTLHPDAQSIASAINNRGVVAGTDIRPDGSETAFIWTRSSGLLAILPDATATDINDRNIVVGRQQACEIGLGCTSSGFLWSAKTGVTNLGRFFPFAINNKGDMAGSCGFESFSQACVLIDGTVIEIGPSVHGGFATDINARGVVSGWAWRPQDGGLAPYAFTWSASEGVRLLDEADADTSSAEALNNRGTVVGVLAYHGAESRINAAIWSRSNLERLGGSAWTMASGVNERGWVVGIISIDGLSPNRPLLWIPGQPPITLPSGAGNEGWFAADINNSGQIVGAVNTPEGSRAALWRVRP